METLMDSYRFCGLSFPDIVALSDVCMYVMANTHTHID